MFIIVFNKCYIEVAHSLSIQCHIFVFSFKWFSSFRLTLSTMKNLDHVINVIVTK